MRCEGAGGRRRLGLPGRGSLKLIPYNWTAPAQVQAGGKSKIRLRQFVHDYSRTPSGKTAVGAGRRCGLDRGGIVEGRKMGPFGHAPGLERSHAPAESWRAV